MIKKISINIVIIAFSIFMLVVSSQLSAPVGGGELGPGFYPKIILYILIALNIIDLLTKFIRHMKQREEWEFRPQIMLSRFALLVILMGGYVASLGWVDYRINTFLFVFVIMLIINVKDYKKALITSVGFVLFLYTVFDLILNVPMP